MKFTHGSLRLIRKVEGLEDIEDSKRYPSDIVIKSEGLTFHAGKTWDIEATGEVEDLIVDTTLFPEPIEVKEGNIKVVEKKVIVSDAKVNASDSSLRMSATINHNMSELVKMDIGFQGEMGKESMKWIENRFKLPPELSIRPPLSIPEAQANLGKGFRHIICQ